MTQSAPLILGVFGLALLAVEVWATVTNRRRLQAHSHRQRFVYRACMWALGVPLLYLSLFTKYDLHSNVRVFGAPFLAAVWEYDGKNWIDFTGPLTLPAFIGNGAIFFLLPQLIVAGWMRIVNRH